MKYLLKAIAMPHDLVLTNASHFFEVHNRKVSLFKDLSLRISSDKNFAIVGPSGAGKSSLLMLLAGLDVARQGVFSYLINGKPASIDQLRQHSGFIFQQFHLLPEMNALGNLALPLKLKGVKKSEEKAKEWLEKVGLSERASHYPSQLSGGEQQRIAIARAFISNPKFVFADEPTGNLDEKTANDITRLMFDISESHQTGLVIVTHSRKLAECADVQYCLADGHITKIQAKTEWLAS